MCSLRKEREKKTDWHRRRIKLHVLESPELIKGESKKKWLLSDLCYRHDDYASAADVWPFLLVPVTLHTDRRKTIGLWTLWEVPRDPRSSLAEHPLRFRTSLEAATLTIDSEKLASDPNWVKFLRRQHIDTDYRARSTREGLAISHTLHNDENQWRIKGSCMLKEHTVEREESTLDDGT